tara:strand:- start:5647 stop:6312 length:666 start_codon:yes stop_codon:yes gene_type:complete
MKKDISTIAQGLGYMQSKLNGTFVIQFVKKGNKWQFAPSTSAKSEKIKCKTFDQMIKKGHDYMAKKFKKKYGFSYEQDFSKDSKILELENIIKELKKSNKMTVRQVKLTKFNSSIEDLKLEDFGFDDKKTPKNSVKKGVHKEIFKKFKGIIIHKDGDFAMSNEKIEIKTVNDVYVWAKLDPKDYKRVYTNAYQRLAHRRRLKKLSKRSGGGMTIGSSQNHI